MKFCPKCREVYADDEINFCLGDGTTLEKGNPIQGKTLHSSLGRSRKSEIGHGILRLLQILAILGFVTSCGSCVACVGLSGPMKYGQEEEYSPGKMGARSYSSSEEQDKIFAFVSLGGAVVFVVVGFASLVLKETLD